MNVRSLRLVWYSRKLPLLHARTANKEGKIVTKGERVLGVVAKGEGLNTARKNAYKAVENVSFDNKNYRSDIGKSIE